MDLFVLVYYAKKSNRQSFMICAYCIQYLYANFGWFFSKVAQRIFQLIKKHKKRIEFQIEYLKSEEGTVIYIFLYSIIAQILYKYAFLQLRINIVQLYDSIKKTNSNKIKFNEIIAIKLFTLLKICYAW